VWESLGGGRCAGARGDSGPTSRIGLAAMRDFEHHLDNNAEIVGMD
jgi:hypothetical protein